MNRAYLWLLAAAAALGTTACTEEQLTLSQGSQSTVNIRVYVDADGSGAFEAANDVPIASVTVSAEGDASASGTTDDQGLATFQVPPGSYTITVSGEIPTGAVLSTASSITVRAPFQGETLEGEFRYSFNPGGLSGVVFRDDNANGTFDSGVDTPAGGIDVVAFEGAAADNDTAGVESTDSDGAFSFDGLRPGSYELVLTPFPTITFVDGPTRTATVDAQATTNLEIEFTGNLVVSLSDARSVPDGEAVAIEGVINFQAPWRSTLDGFVQDGGGGIALFDFDCDFNDPATNCPQVAIGDQVRVVGTRGSFRGELQITDITLLEILGSPGEPSPIAVTAAEINAGEFQGQLVTLDGTVDSLQVFSFDNHAVFLRDGAGDTFRVFVDSRTGVGSADWVVGVSVTITGVMAFDDRNAPGPTIEIRSPDDRLSSVITMANARNLIGDTVTVEGILTWQAQFRSTLDAFFQDGTAGLTMFDFGVDATTLQRGDRLRVRGRIGAFRGEVQFEEVIDLQVVGKDVVPVPQVVTAADIDGGNFNSQLVTITGTVDSVTDIDGFDNHTVFLTDGAAGTFKARVDSRIGVGSADWPVGQDVQVVGVIGTDDRDAIPNRVELRGPEDLITGGVNVIPISSARGMPGAVVTVEGVLTWEGFRSTMDGFMQDGGAGIAMFDFGIDVTALQRGDRLRVTGTVGDFQGDVQIGSITDFVVIGQDAVPDPRPVTGAQINNGDFPGELAVVTGVVDSVIVLDTFDNHIAWLTDGAGTEFTAFVDTRNGMSSSDWTVGATTRVTGVLGRDDRNTPSPRIEPRDLSDLQ